LRGNDPEPDHAGERALLTATIREAGALALTTFQKPLKTWTKGESSPVSEADIAVDNLLRRRLARPSFGWLSEESDDDRPRREAAPLWIVDPIDGTRSYLAGRPDWVISVALVAQGRPVLAALFAPVSDELFMATAGAGATRNGVPIGVSAGGRLDGSTVAGPKRLVQALAALASGITVPPRIGSLALRLARVAQGELDLAFASGTSHDWDLAGADLLVHEAGGAMTSLVGRTLTYNQPELVHGSLVAAGAERHAALIDIARDRPAEFA
jgi:myo-inositol-1(or 4)-monophosphatase